MKIPTPHPTEYAPYAQQYIKLLPEDGSLIEFLEESHKEGVAFLRSFPVVQLTEPHAPGEWTIQEVLLHVLDVERIFAYRILRLARHDETMLPGFDQDAYVVDSRANERSIESLLDEYTAVRHATLTLLKSLTEDDLLRRGEASGTAVTVRGLIYHMAGHERHHRLSLEENYKE